MRLTSLKAICQISVLFMFYASCSGGLPSNISPYNWFKTPKPLSFNSAPPSVFEGHLSTLRLIEDKITPDNRLLIPTLIDLRVEPHTTGAIIVATGQARAKRRYNAELTVQTFQDGLLTLDFKASASESQASSESPQGIQEVTVATTISKRNLAKVKKVIVNAQNNALVFTP